MGEHWRRRFHWVCLRFIGRAHFGAGVTEMEWTTQRRAWTIVRCFSLSFFPRRRGSSAGLKNIAAAMFRWRVAVELGKGA
jgi:hypothetical protein